MLTQKGFFALGRACRELADRHAQGRMVLTQEGGYNISYTAFCVHAVMEGVLKLPQPLLADPLEGVLAAALQPRVRADSTRPARQARTRTRRCATRRTRAWRRSSSA